MFDSSNGKSFSATDPNGWIIRYSSDTETGYPDADMQVEVDPLEKKLKLKTGEGIKQD